MTGRTSIGCARGDCCQHWAGDGEGDVEAIAERVVKDVVTAHLEILMSRGTASLATETVPAMGDAITEALVAAAKGVAYRLVVHGGLHRGRVSATRRVGAHNDKDWPPNTISATVGGGLCVISGPCYSWIVHAPTMQLAVTP